MTFTGFTSNTLYTPVPNPIFGPVLEQIEDLGRVEGYAQGIVAFAPKESLRLAPWRWKSSWATGRCCEG